MALPTLIKAAADIERGPSVSTLVTESTEKIRGKGNRRRFTSVMLNSLVVKNLIFSPTSPPSFILGERV